MAIEPEVLLVNKEYIVKYTYLNNAVDADLVESSIIVAQDVHLEDIIGSELLREVKAGSYPDLLDNYIRRVVCWWAFSDILGKIYIKADAGGLFMRTADNGEQITSDEYRMKRSEAESIARKYSKKLTDYLTKNKDLFPSLYSNAFPDVNPQGNPYKGSRLRVSGGAQVYSTRTRDKYL